MSENVKHTILRFALVFGVILVMFVVVFLRIISLQTVHRAELEAMVADQARLDSLAQNIRQLAIDDSAERVAKIAIGELGIEN